MKNIGKKVRILLMLALMTMMMCAVTAFAADNTSYVMGGISNSKSTVKVGGYSVRVKNDKLYTKKGDGSWKSIASAGSQRMGNDFTTNGKTVYYSVYGNYDSTIYSIKTNGKSKKKIKTFSAPSVEPVYRYGDNLYLNWEFIDYVKRYSLETGKLKTISEEYYTIHGAYKQHLLIAASTTGGPACPTKLISYNAKSGKKTTLTNKAHCYMYLQSGSKVYYAKYNKYTGDGKLNTFQINRCKLDGSENKALTKSFRAMYIMDMTTKYVKYRKSWDGRDLKITY